MKACFIESYGGLEVMQVGELPVPGLRRGEVRVAIEAASINPVDAKIRSGDFRLVTGRAFPRVLGVDLAGTVAELGPHTSGLTVGERVYGTTPIFASCHGSHAEFAVAAPRALRRIPAGLSAIEAAALPAAALTALHGLQGFSELDGRHVLVNGATGGVGHIALQVAKARGANITAVASASSLDFARELGADEVVDYGAGDLARVGPRFDVVFDAHGGLGFAAAAPLLTACGSYVTTHSFPREYLYGWWRRIRGGRQLVPARLRAQPEDYAEIEALLGSGQIRVVIDRVYPLDETAQALEALERGGVRGKIVIQVK